MPPSPGAWRHPLAILLLATGVTALYLPSIRNGFVYDDHEVIVAQRRPVSASELVALFAEPHFHGLPYYRPLVRASLLGQKALHGDRPAPFHLANALLAGALAAAAAWLLRTPALGVAPAAALFAAALFALHPAASSAVYPIASGRETLLPALLVLLAVGAWLRGRRAAAAGLLAGALLGKEQAVVVPAVWLAGDALGLAGPRPARLAGWLRRYAPALAVLLAYAAVRQLLFAGSELRLALADDPLGPLRSLAFALQTGFAPFASLRYEPEVGTWWSWPRLAAALAGLAGLAALVRAAAAPPARVVAFWTAWFVVIQLPTANLLRQEARFDERYAFLALLAIPAVGAAAATALWRRLSLSRASRAALLAVPALAGCALGAISLGRAAAFRDDAAFAAAWLRADPGAPEAHHTLGLLASLRGDWSEAEAHYRAGLVRAPDAPEIRHNRATALAALGRTDEARRELEQVLRLDARHPEAHLNLGALLAGEGREAEAVAHFREAVRSDPDRPAAHAALGAALARLGRRDEAVAALQEALRLDPADARARRELAVIEGGVAAP